MRRIYRQVTGWIVLWALFGRMNGKHRIVAAAPMEGSQPTGEQDRVRVLGKRMHRRLITTSREDKIFTPVASSPAPQPQELQLVIAGTVPGTARCLPCAAQLQAEQDAILNSLYETYGTTNVHLVSRETFLTNAQFVTLTTTTTTSDDDEDDEPTTIQETIRHMAGVQAVAPSRDWQILQQPSTPTILDVADDYVTATAARRAFCVNGQGVRVAVLDTGVDYTHAIFGGPGTAAAYADAYGSDDEDALSAATTRDAFFPTEQVVDGFDFIGDGDIRLLSDITPDDDPIDRPNGHGTRVASCVVAIAPAVDLLAIKVCSPAGCPESAILAGLSYAVRQGAKVINLSLGTPWSGSFYSVLAQAAEEAIRMGIVVVISAGNNGNIPFVMGQVGGTHNAITVGATDTASRQNVMATFSSRGLGDGVRLKPDLSAPGGSLIAASAGSGRGGSETRGTSFSSPFVAGAAALILEKCPTCSPFAVKALLMNNADRDVRYFLDDELLAPLSWAGNGELQVLGSLDAGMWAYSVDDVQPSISLGVINAFEDMTITRTIRLTKMVAEDLRVHVRTQIRDPDKAAANVIRVTASPSVFDWSGACGDEMDVDVQFSIFSLRAPDNRMTSSGRVANDPTNLDLNEFDGWVVIEYQQGQTLAASIIPTSNDLEFERNTSSIEEASTDTPVEKNASSIQEASSDIPVETNASSIKETGGEIRFDSNSSSIEQTSVVFGSPKDIAVPFHSIIRRASDVVSDSSVLPSLDRGTQNVEVNLFNNGAGDALIDVFELLHISSDDGESLRGSERPSADFNYIGYRSVPGIRPNCDFVLEFAFHLWENHRRLVQTQLQVRLDLDLDGQTDVILANRGQAFHDTQFSDCRILQSGSTQWACSGFAPDHNTNSATTIIRACSNDLGITDEEVVDVSFLAFGVPSVSIEADRVDFRSLRLPSGSLSAPSYDIPPGNTLRSISVTAAEQLPTPGGPLGMLLVTSGWRDMSNTGAASRRSEVVPLVFADEPLPTEQTEDVLAHPVVTDLVGPGCDWTELPEECPVERRMLSSSLSLPLHPVTDISDLAGQGRHLQDVDENCPENRIPRITAVTLPPSERVPIPTYPPSIAPTSLPTTAPTETPSAAPSPVPSVAPSDRPSTSPSRAPTDMPSTKHPTVTPTATVPTASPTTRSLRDNNSLPSSSAVVNIQPWIGAVVAAATALVLVVLG
jgi:hypothetical protein